MHKTCTQQDHLWWCWCVPNFLIISLNHMFYFVSVTHWREIHGVRRRHSDYILYFGCMKHNYNNIYFDIIPQWYIVMNYDTSILWLYDVWYLASFEILKTIFIARVPILRQRIYSYISLPSATNVGTFAHFCYTFVHFLSIGWCSSGKYILTFSVLSDIDLTWRTKAAFVRSLR